MLFLSLIYIYSFSTVSLWHNLGSKPGENLMECLTPSYFPTSTVHLFVHPSWENLMECWVPFYLRISACSSDVHTSVYPSIYSYLSLQCWRLNSGSVILWASTSLLRYILAFLKCFYLPRPAFNLWAFASWVAGITGLPSRHNFTTILFIYLFIFF